MDLAQQGHVDWMRTGGRSKVGSRLLWTSLMSIGLAAAFFAGLMYSESGVGTSTGAVTVDPLAQPAVIEFRRSEHATTGGAAVDPLAQPALIEFRRSEHATTGGATVDPLAQPAAIEFRNSERDESR
jgi:hypothetical protein